MTASILVVDDSLTVRMDLAESFEDAGYRVVACGSVAEARAALDRESFALAVLDVVLPDGDGFELLRAIRAMPSPPPILMLSTEAEVKDRARGMQTGADDYVGKPYEMTYVLARARALVRDTSLATPAAATVLVIDDSPTFRGALREALEAEGYAVHEAASGDEGLRLADRVRPAAVVVDGMMSGVDGPTFIRHMRLDAAMRGTPCLLLTASDERGAELRALDAGADAFARKDEGLDAILARLGALLRSAVHERKEAESLLAPKRVLAVDDSPTYLDAVTEALQLDGYDVVPARSGAEAIEMLAVQPIDCVLLDVMMPGLSGKETCRRIKDSPVAREIPLIMLTSLEDREAMLDGLSMGADDYIAKSSDFGVIRARVRAQLRRKQFEDEHRRVRDALLRSELDASEARAAQRVAEARADLVEELEQKNRELEAFSYSVSHDLRAPLRHIDGFSRALVEDCAEQLDDIGRGHLQRVRRASDRMAVLIDDLMKLSRVGRAELVRSKTSISEIARDVLEDLARADPERGVELRVRPDLGAFADPGLVRVLLENLLGNAWKFTRRRTGARIEVGALDGEPGWFVRDNGAGFAMEHATRLFAPFQRLHSEQAFPGTGIGLATAQRVVDRHGGRIWAEAEVDRGATFSFTLESRRRSA